MTIVSLRDQILATDDIPTETVYVPEWDVTVEVRGMTGAARSDILEKAASSDTGKIGVGGLYVETVIATCYDPATGTQVFGPADAGVLTTKSAAALDRLAMIGMRLSGMGEGAQDDAKEQFPAEPES